MSRNIELVTRLADGRLLQINKKFSQLKESQRNLIAGWLYDECLVFLKKQTKLKMPFINYYHISHWSVTCK